MYIVLGSLWKYTEAHTYVCFVCVYCMCGEKCVYLFVCALYDYVWCVCVGVCVCKRILEVHMHLYGLFVEIH